MMDDDVMLIQKYFGVWKTILGGNMFRDVSSHLKTRVSLSLD